ncbi:MAG: ABC transporter substrate-binding protein [Clostridia bacterium]|nr:ABC transporter substrate-binding protein [Clostridia bacterium]MBP3651579.1 ABC transporter substrate-binding protein [Clostridia bacterium]
MKRYFAMLVAALMVFSFAAVAEEAQYSIGICQLVQHDALDSATQGFMDILTEKLGDKVSFNVQNASGDSATCITIANAFIAEEVDLILANSTQALQAVYAATGDIPILGTSITDYAAALDMDEWTGVTGVNVSGASDLAPLIDQAELLRQMFPTKRNVGLLYCSAEANSEYQATIMKGLLTAMGYICTDFTFTDTNDVFSVAHAACAGSDVIFVPTDNTVASCREVIRNAVETENTPIIGGDEGICTGCGVATLAVDYYELGRVSGEMAYEVLVNGADVSAMPIRFSQTFAKQYNPEMCALLGIEVPEGFEAIH